VHGNVSLSKPADMQSAARGMLPCDSSHQRLNIPLEMQTNSLLSHQNVCPRGRSSACIGWGPTPMGGPSNPRLQLQPPRWGGSPPPQTPSEIVIHAYAYSRPSLRSSVRTIFHPCSRLAQTGVRPYGRPSLRACPYNHPFVRSFLHTNIHSHSRPIRMTEEADDRQRTLVLDRRHTCYTDDTHSQKLEWPRPSLGAANKRTVM